jgi:hypothetical protein
VRPADPPCGVHAPAPALDVQTASGWVLRESKAVYRAASEGVINLADKFFEMERSNALRCGRGRPIHAGCSVQTARRLCLDLASSFVACPSLCLLAPPTRCLM